MPIHWESDKSGELAASRKRLMTYVRALSFLSAGALVILTVRNVSVAIFWLFNECPIDGLIWWLIKGLTIDFTRALLKKSMEHFQNMAKQIWNFPNLLSPWWWCCILHICDQSEFYFVAFKRMWNWNSEFFEWVMSSNFQRVEFSSDSKLPW